MSSLADRRCPPGLPRGVAARVLVALGVASVGGAVTLALALLMGAVHTSATTTVTRRAPPPAVPEAATGAWAGVYARAAAGEVDITVRVTSIVETPYGPRQEQAAAQGSGFVLDGRGDLLTAAHVVEGATSISVAFADGIVRSAIVLGRDDASDVAVLRVSPAGLTLHPLPLGSSAALAVGEPLAVLGDPLGFSHSLSTGVVSALDRTIEAPNGFQIAHAIQTDAAMNPGNSGGPLLDGDGRVIGIADQIATGNNQFGGPSSSTTSTGVGFAVPIGLIRAELPALEQGRAVSHAYLGLGTGQTSDGSAGALVVTVQSASPATAAGLRPGDVIVSWNGVAVTSESALVDLLAGARPGQQVKMTILRDGARLTLNVRLGTQPVQAPAR